MKGWRSGTSRAGRGKGRGDGPPCWASAPSCWARRRARRRTRVGSVPGGLHRPCCRCCFPPAPGRRCPRLLLSPHPRPCCCCCCSRNHHRVGSCAEECPEHRWRLKRVCCSVGCRALCRRGSWEDSQPAEKRWFGPDPRDCLRQCPLRPSFLSCLSLALVPIWRRWHSACCGCAWWRKVFLGTLVSFSLSAG